MDANIQINSLPDKVYEQALRDVIETNLKKNISEFELVYSAGSAKGEGFIAEIYRIQVKDKKSNEPTLNLIVKLPPLNEMKRNVISNHAFKRESIFYGEVYPMYLKFQEEKGIDVQKDGFHEVPRCYKTICTDTHQAVFLEDLKTSGFELKDDLKPMTKEHAFLVMKSLAKMHALFYAMKDQKPDLVQHFFDLPEMSFILHEQEGSPFEFMFEMSKQHTLNAAGLTKNEAILGKVEKVLEKSFIELLMEIFDPKKSKPYATLCHGDCWNNNTMVHFDEHQTASELRLLDFQIFRYSSPATDLVYFIFLCTDKSFRDKHYQECLDFYYLELASFMRRLGSNPDIWYPRKIFEQDLKNFGKFAMVMAVIALPIMMSDKKDTLNFGEIAEDMKKAKETGNIEEKDFKFTKTGDNVNFVERMMGVCEDMHRLGYI